MRILCMDYGERRLGFAVSDETQMLATPLRVVTIVAESQAFGITLKLLAEIGAGRLVLGLPLNMNGSRGPQAKKVAAFGERLKVERGVDVVLWDERLSSREVERVLILANSSRARRRQVIDKLSAQVVLQSYLDSLCFTAGAPLVEDDDHGPV